MNLNSLFPNNPVPTSGNSAQSPASIMQQLNNNVLGQDSYQMHHQFQQHLPNLQHLGLQTNSLQQPKPDMKQLLVSANMNPADLKFADQYPQFVNAQFELGLGPFSTTPTTTAAAMSGANSHPVNLEQQYMMGGAQDSHELQHAQNQMFQMPGLNFDSSLMNYLRQPSAMTPQMDKMPNSTEPPLTSFSAMQAIQAAACAAFHAAAASQQLSAKNGKRKKYTRRKQPKTNEVTVCSNCQAVKTPLWRKGENGKKLCNKCGLYWSRHNKDRPLKLGRASRRQNSTSQQGQEPSNGSPSQSPQQMQHLPPLPSSTPSPESQHASHPIIHDYLHPQQANPQPHPSFHPHSQAHPEQQLPPHHPFGMMQFQAVQTPPDLLSSPSPQHISNGSRMQIGHQHSAPLSHTS